MAAGSSGTGFGHGWRLCSSYAWRWNILNGARMALTAITAVYLFSAFRKLDRG